MACKLQVELAISHMVQPLLKQHKVRRFRKDKAVSIKNAKAHSKE